MVMYVGYCKFLLLKKNHDKVITVAVYCSKKMLRSQ